MTNGEKYIKSLEIQLKVTETCLNSLDQAFDLALTHEAKEFKRFLMRRLEKIKKSIEAYER